MSDQEKSTILDMTLSERFKLAMKEANVSASKLIKATGASKATVYLWLGGTTQELSSEFLFKAAKELGVRAEWLGEGKGPMRDDGGQEPPNVTEGPPIRGKVPLISWVQAGDFAALVDNYQPGDAEMWIDSVVPVRRHTFALRVKGDSMTPEFNEGEVVIIEPDADAENGSFVVVRNGDAECTLKQLVRDGGAAFLKPMNERYPIYPFPADGVIVGVVKGKMKLY